MTEVVVARVMVTVIWREIVTNLFSPQSTQLNPVLGLYLRGGENSLTLLRIGCSSPTNNNSVRFCIASIYYLDGLDSWLTQSTSLLCIICGTRLFNLKPETSMRNEVKNDRCRSRSHYFCHDKKYFNRKFKSCFWRFLREFLRFDSLLNKNKLWLTKRKKII